MFGDNTKKEKEIDRITYFANTNSRGQRVKFGIRDSDRTKHIYMIGKSGMGKSTTLENLAVQDIQNGNGLCFIDPHGSAVDTFLDYIPENRIEDVIYFAPFDFEHPVAFNVMENVSPDKRSLLAQGLLSTFKKIWGEESFSDRMEHIVSNTLLALLEYPDSTILSISRMFVDIPFQKKVISHITDPVVKAFWTKEYASWSDNYRKDAYSAVLNKLGQFASNPIVRNIVGQPKSSFDIREIMDNQKLLLVNLSIGQVGEANANLLGAMFTTKIFLAGMSRADLSKPDLAKTPPFYLYIDEFQNLANDSFADILAQARKYKLNLTLAHQYIEQMPETVRAAVFGNVGTLISFRVGATDAEVLSREFAEIFSVDDLVSLGIGQVYLSLMINGIGSRPFSAGTLMPLDKPAVSFREEVIEASRKTYARERSVVEKEISDWMSEGQKPAGASPQGQGGYQKNKPQGAKQYDNKKPSDQAGPKKDFVPSKPTVSPITDEMKQDLPGAPSFADALKGLISGEQEKDKTETENKASHPDKKQNKKLEVQDDLPVKTQEKTEVSTNKKTGNNKKYTGGKKNNSQTATEPKSEKSRINPHKDKKKSDPKPEKIDDSGIDLKAFIKKTKKN